MAVTHHLEDELLYITLDTAERDLTAVQTAETTVDFETAMNDNTQQLPNTPTLKLMDVTADRPGSRLIFEGGLFYP